MSDIYALSLIQGISEAFPISSSAHLLLARLSGFIKSQPSLSLDAALHLGTLFAVIIFFYKDVLKVLQGFLDCLQMKGNTSFAVLFKNLCYASLPSIFIGLIIHLLKIDQIFSSPIYVAILSFIFGALLWLVDVCVPQKKNEFRSAKDCLLIGCAQILAFFPGVSRLGICITASRSLGYEREQSIRFSFLMGMVSMAGAVFLKFKALQSAFSDFLNVIFFILITCVLNLIFLSFFVKLSLRYGFKIFSFYRILLSCLIFYFLMR